ncbi:MAG: isochorismate synthase [Actinobacteria bacterium]|jgi:menaquinone-specific isochorismate synthase|nr:isochorismate synthase [Actinomycetota bacterium]NCV42148.1 isochorismate synthase [Actinomycetota bacterium]NCV82349.1 isochorismate synthase [Actinomycetota bacterium]NCW72394.1 isochorismate synthase [Actinomycetota bacterium]NCX16032.1 isochorismate synthase [Actinomycetota bacterium]
MTSLIPVTTTRLGEHLPLLDLLPDSAPTAWVRGGEGLVGWGVYATTTVSGPHRFADARHWWQKQLETFAVTNTVHGNGTGPILFSSFSFSPDDVSVLVIPKVIVGKKGDKSWVTWVGSDPQPILNLEKIDLPKTSITWEVSESSEKAWKSRVKTAVDRIQNNELDKVVLARDVLGTSKNTIDARYILKTLSAEYPSTWNFSVAGLVGATPELLLRLTKSMVTSRVLAGTISKTGDDERDLALAASLARSSKDLEEHEYAVRSVADAIEPFCTSINVPESPFVLHLANVMHLATDVTGALAETLTHVDAFTILEQLHPSAAVCGTPRDKAAALINEIEAISRGRYAGPVGWIDAAGDGELGIALRCGQIKGDSIRIFAGCGIVAGSDPVKELAESEAKFIPMRSALV